MEYSKPEGCQAAVTGNWETIYSGGLFSGATQQKFTARVFCGDRQAECVDSFTEEVMGINHSVHTEQVIDSVTGQVNDVLGAICLGCPHNTERD